MRFLPALLIIIGCSATPEPLGDPAVLADIEATTDCTELQSTFDTAAANHERSVEGGDGAAVTLAYMQAADARMLELGCY